MEEEARMGQGENQGTEGGRDVDAGVDEGEDKKGPRVDTTKRQKRRLDYTSPAARSLFGRNRFFITKSFVGLYTKLYIRRPPVKLTGIPRTHRVPESHN